MSGTTAALTDELIAAPFEHDHLVEGIESARQRHMPVLLSATHRIPHTDALSFYGEVSRYYDNTTYIESPSGGTTLVGCGQEIVFTTQGARDTQDVIQEWRALLDNALTPRAYLENGLGPVLLGGFAFDPASDTDNTWQGFPKGLLTLPSISLHNHNGESWLTHNLVIWPDDDYESVAARNACEPCPYTSHTPYMRGDEEDVARTRLSGNPRSDADDTNRSGPAAQEDSSLFAHRGDRRHPVLTEYPPADVWKRSVEEAARLARSGRVRKLVLARSVRAEYPDRIEPIAVLAWLREHYPGCNIFAARRGESTFLGASPERLVSLRNGVVNSGSLAGSRPRGETEHEDDALAAQLLSSAKDLEEHGIVVEAITESLRDICNDIESGGPGLLRLENVQHLYTPVRAKARPGCTVLDLVERLHPTPAVGGWPRAEAPRLIRQLERMDRGWYAGPLGWMDSSGDGEFAVAIRSALLTNNVATLFAGCGIVGDSDPELEYEESKVKLNPLLSAIGKG